MKDPQQEVEELRAGVNCATVLEKATPPWLLDRKKSSKRCLKYRRGAGEIVIVRHGGAGWCRLALNWGLPHFPCWLV